MFSWKSQRHNDENRFYLQIETDNKKQYQQMELAARLCIDGIKIHPLNHASWNRRKLPSGTHEIYCSNCMMTARIQSDWCQHCGAKMDIKL